MSKINHYIIANSAWNEDKLKFRRHRLAEYLLEQTETNKVFWIYPISIHSLSRIKEYKKSILNVCNEEDNGIYTVGLIDLKGFISHFSSDPFQQIKIKKLRKRERKVKNFIWFTHPGFSWLLNNQFEWDKIIYDCSDNWGNPFLKRSGVVGFLEDIRSASVKKSENKIVKKSDYLYATSEYLKNHISTMTKKEITVIENGVETDLFLRKSEDKEIFKKIEGLSHPRIGFVGGLKHKIDYNLLIEIASIKKNYNILLVGPIPDNKPKDLLELLKLKNVHYLGTALPEDVPLYMKYLDIGLMPYKDIEYNKAISPLKLFEYIAAGIPTIGSGLPITKKYVEEGIYYYSENSPEEYIKIIEGILKLDNELYSSRKLELAQQNSWKRKLSYIVSNVMD